MGAMSDLHLLATRHLETGDSIHTLAHDSGYSASEIQWAVNELKEIEGEPTGLSQ